MRLAATLFLIMLMSTQTAAQAVLVEDSMYARSLKRLKPISVLLPPRYTPERRYPVLYLLHGWRGHSSDWHRLSGIRAYLEQHPLIVVMPDADTSWYVNSASRPEDRFEDYLSRDVPEYVATRFSSDTTRQAIAGISMGGYGALVLALRHPRQYWFAGVMSASLDIPRGIASLQRNKRGHFLPSIRAAFGDSLFRAAHDPFLLYRLTSPDSLPYLYLVTGIQEEFEQRLFLYRTFADSLRSYRAAYEFHETPGAHDFVFWDRELWHMLRRMEHRTREQYPPRAGQ